MLVQNSRMPVPMAMRLVGRRVRRVLMLVVEVMHVAMFMLERFMQMLVVVRLGEVQIDANAISSAAPIRVKVGVSPNSGSARAAPIKGAVEK
jgi:hypothetical protein